MRKEQANYRLDAEAKRQAYKVLSQIGLRPTDAVNMFMRHIAMYGELPFKPSVPNDETLATFEKTDKEQELTRHAILDDIFKDV